MSETKRRYSLFPKTLASCIEPLTRPVFKAKGLAGSRILSQWPEVVGNALATRCYPEKLTFPHGKTTDGTLTIAVENGFATEMQYMIPAILERLATYYGYKAVSRIAISHSYAPARAPREKEPRIPPLADDYAALSEEIADPELKDALQSLAKTLAGKSG